MKRHLRRALVVGVVLVSAGLASIAMVAATLLPRPVVDEPLHPVDWPGRSHGDVIEGLRAGYDREVEPILRDHCYACHVDSRFDRGEPWIGEWVDPVQARVDEHVELGLAALDLSGGFPFVRDGVVDLESQPALLRNLEASLRERAMPPRDFLILHPFEPITDDQRQKVQAWTLDALARLTGTPQLTGVQGEIVSDLARACGGCHGPARTIGGPEVTDLAALVDAGWVVPGDADASKMLKRIADGNMPPSGAAPARLLDNLRKWVEAGAQVESDRRSAASREELLQTAVDDLESLSPGRRRFVRYFTAEHLSQVRDGPAGNAVAADALRLVLSGLSRTPNTVELTQVRPSLALFRADLSTIGVPPDEFEVIERAYPLDWRAEGGARLLSDRIRTLTGADVDVFALDWFVRTATLPPLYPTLRQVPERMGDLARAEGLELCHLDGGQVRAGFRESGVSAFNRVVERHDTSSGAFWISYDFGRREDSADVLQHPLGPPCTDVADAFVPDGSELIWSLPNGLHAYALYDGEGHRLDIDAPRDIVQDGREAISNASSCMGCHLNGFLDVTNDVPTRGASPPIAKLYVGDDALDALIGADNSQYQAALLAAGISPLHERPPVSVVRGRYEQPVHPEEVASFLSLPSVKSLKSLQDLPADSPLAPLARGESIARVDYLRSFAELVEALEQGEARPPLQRLPFDDQERRATLQTPRVVDARTIRYRTVQLPVDERLLLVGTTEISQGNWQQVLGDPPLSCLRPILVETIEDPLTLSQPDRPVVCVSFRDALAFANALSVREQLTPAYVIRDFDAQLRPDADGYRLPTDLEWRQAMGSRDGRFAGDVVDGAACGIANVRSTADERRLGDATKGVDAGSDGDAAFQCVDGFAGLAPVGSFEPNAHGLFDISGNAAEWTWPDGERTVPLAAPQTLRGGSWLSGTTTAPATTTVRRPGNTRNPTAGLRLVRPQERPPGLLSLNEAE